MTEYLASEKSFTRLFFSESRESKERQVSRNVVATGTPSRRKRWCWGFNKYSTRMAEDGFMTTICSPEWLRCVASRVTSTVPNAPHRTAASHSAISKRFRQGQGNQGGVKDLVKSGVGLLWVRSEENRKIKLKLDR